MRLMRLRAVLRIRHRLAPRAGAKMITGDYIASGTNSAQFIRRISVSVTRLR